MSQISPPIRIVLACAIGLVAAWMLFLRPQAEPAVPPAATTPAAAAGGEAATTAAGSVVEQANAAKAATEAQAATAAGESAAAPATTGGTPATPAKPAAKGKAAGLPTAVASAIADHKVVVLLFWSPRAADDRAVRKELAGVDRHGRKVVVHAAPMKRFARYQGITRGAAVEQSPTVVVVDRDRKVETLVGFVDRVSIDQAVTDALRSS
jgi:hypothetical protein